jgi:hypothetical protein
MLNGIDANQIYLLIILARAAVLLFTEWIRLDLTAILKVPAWHNRMIPRGGFDPAQAQSWYFVRSHSV